MTTFTLQPPLGSESSDRIPQDADPLDLQLDDVAGLEPAAVAVLEDAARADRPRAQDVTLEQPRVPRGVVVMNPYENATTLKYVRAFFDKYYSDNREHTLILGINPGRFGAGLTGITFADPVALADDCGIPNEFPRKRELSSIFIFSVINHLGGPREFFSKFFLFPRSIRKTAAPDGS